MDAAEFAEYLRAERERRQLTLEQIADETKIASRHLAALERGDVRNWPGGMYRRAMMRAYAESIGVDREFALRQFQQAFEPPPDPPVPPASAFQIPRSVPALRWRPVLRWHPLRWRPSRRHTLAAAAATLGMVALAIVWQIAGALTVGDANVANAPAVAVAAVPAPESRANVAPAPAPARTALERSAPAATISAREAAATTGSTPSRPLATDANLVVESDPAGARVTVNGVGWGETPITIRHLEFGSKRIRLTLQGYVSQERIVQLGPERAGTRVRVALRAR